MARTCDLTGKRRLVGNNVSHAKIEQELSNKLIFKLKECMILKQEELLD